MKNQSHIHHPQWESNGGGGEREKKGKESTLSSCRAPTGPASLYPFGSRRHKPTEHVRSEGQSNPEVRLSSSNLRVQAR